MYVLTGAMARAGDCLGMMKSKLAHVTVTSAQMIPAGTAPAGDAIPPVKIDYCRIQATARPTADSEIRFELWIPSAGWNGKFEQVGNGGFAGAIPYRPMAQVVSLGYAVAGTDDGHRSDDMTDASWALNHPEKIKDYGWRAIAETTIASKRFVRDLKSRAPAHSYFAGCSDGGREALMMAQRFPTFFDGIIAGAPAFAMTRLLTGGALRSAELGGVIGHLSASHLALLQHHALQSCGNGAAYIEDPRRCRIDLAALKCSGGDSETCLSETEINTARVIYAERKDPASGRALYGVLPGAEAVSGSWDAWLTGTDDRRPSAGMGFTWNYLAYMVMKDPKLDVTKVTAADMIRGERTYAPVMDSDDPDLAAFKAHGGKLIQYHGWNDPAIPPGYSLEYRERVAARTSGLGDFYRLYMVPGMLHCGGGDAPTSVDWQGALEAWVERSVAPAALAARDGKGAVRNLPPFD
ncbi:MAG: Tannase/feruloyl esterase family alpha/beta hydrolase [Gammaproteobacteria bacterium]|nr:Tannase/feruloyl esterase family alpha/beta hydrolase [Gammaproteobacteria bacterium]